MKKNLWNASFICLIALSFLISPISSKADFYIKKLRHTDAVTIMGQTQPAKDDEGGTWLAKDKMREDQGENQTFIIRFDLNKIYFLDHSKRTYSEMDLPIDLEKILPPEAKQMMQMMQASSKVTDTSETQKIKNWNCKKYLVEISMSMMGMSMPMKMEMWATKDIGIDLKIYNKFSEEMLALNPMTRNFVEEFKKIDGYPVLTNFSMTMMGAETKYREEVVSVEEKGAPPGIYDLPQGYTKSVYNPFEQRD